MPRKAQLNNICAVSGGEIPLTLTYFDSEPSQTLAPYYRRRACDFKNAKLLVGTSSTVVLLAEDSKKLHVFQNAKYKELIIGTTALLFTEVFTSVCVSCGDVFAGTSAGRIFTWLPRYCRTECLRGLLLSQAPDMDFWDDTVAEGGVQSQAVLSLVVRNLHVISGHADGKIRISFMDDIISEPSISITINAHRGGVEFLSLMGSTLASSSGGIVKVWNVDTLELKWTLPFLGRSEHPPHALLMPCEPWQVQGLHLCADGTLVVGWLDSDGNGIIRTFQCNTDPSDLFPYVARTGCIERREGVRCLDDETTNRFGKKIVIGPCSGGFQMVVARRHIFVQRKDGVLDVFDLYSQKVVCSAQQPSTVKAFCVTKEKAVFKSFFSFSRTHCHN